MFEEIIYFIKKITEEMTLFICMNQYLPAMKKDILTIVWILLLYPVSVNM